MQSQKKPTFYTSQLELPMGAIEADLTRGIIVTILALFLEGGLYAYLQNGGWQKVLSVLSKLSM